MKLTPGLELDEVLAALAVVEQAGLSRGERPAGHQLSAGVRNAANERTIVSTINHTKILIMSRRLRNIASALDEAFGSYPASLHDDPHLLTRLETTAVQMFSFPDESRGETGDDHDDAEVRQSVRVVAGVELHRDPANPHEGMEATPPPAPDDHPDDVVPLHW
jgi:hypothetical protein